MLDPRGQLLRSAVGFAGCSMPSYDRALWALRTWLDSWSGIGHVAVEMAHPRAATLEKRVVRPRVWVLALLACVVACASPATKTSDTPIASEEPRPSFAPGGPDAEEFGASMGYPKGNPATFRSTRSLVGSFSHLDEIFRGRLIHKAPTPSRLVRVAEPRITSTSRG